MPQIPSLDLTSGPSTLHTTGAGASVYSVPDSTKIASSVSPWTYSATGEVHTLEDIGEYDSRLADPTLMGTALTVAPTEISIGTTTSAISDTVEDETGPLHSPETVDLEFEAETTEEKLRDLIAGLQEAIHERDQNQNPCEEPKPAWQQAKECFLAQRAFSMTTSIGSVIIGAAFLWIVLRQENDSLKQEIDIKRRDMRINAVIEASARAQLNVEEGGDEAALPEWYWKAELENLRERIRRNIHPDDNLTNPTRGLRFALRVVHDVRNTARGWKRRATLRIDIMNRSITARRHNGHGENDESIELDDLVAPSGIDSVVSAGGSHVSGTGTGHDGGADSAFATARDSV